MLDIFEKYEIDYLTKPFRLIFSPRTIEDRVKQLEALGGVKAYVSVLFYTRKNFERFIQKRAA